MCVCVVRIALFCEVRRVENRCEIKVGGKCMPVFICLGWTIGQLLGMCHVRRIYHSKSPARMEMCVG